MSAVTPREAFERAAAAAQAAGPTYLAGQELWSLRRLHAYQYEVGEAPGAPQLPSPTVAARTALRALWRSARGALAAPGGRLKTLRSRDIWILHRSGYRRPMVDGAAAPIYALDLVEQLRDRAVLLEHDAYAGPPAGDYPVVALDDLWWMACGFVGVGERALRPATQGKALPLGLDSRSASTLALLLASWEFIGEQWMRACRPSAVFVVDGYGQFMPWQRAAQRLGIPVIELQHGIIHADHPGYRPLTDWMRPALPDHLVLFGERFGEVLDSMGECWAGRWSVSRHPVIARRAERARPWQDAHGVVFFSQPQPEAQEAIDSLAGATSHRLEKTADVIIKPHPREEDPQRTYRAAVASGAKLAPPEADTYALLDEHRVAVSVFSTVALEALAFGRSSLSIPSRHWLSEQAALIDSGDIGVAEGVEDVCRALDHPPMHGPRPGASLFGVGRPALDFEQLVRRVRATERRA